MVDEAKDVCQVRGIRAIFAYPDGDSVECMYVVNNHNDVNIICYC